MRELEFNQALDNIENWCEFKIKWQELKSITAKTVISKKHYFDCDDDLDDCDNNGNGSKS